MMARDLHAYFRLSLRDEYAGGTELARFQGDVHAGSDRASATVLVLLLLVAVLLGAWWLGDHAGFVSFWSNLVPPNPVGK